MAKDLDEMLTDAGLEIGALDAVVDGVDEDVADVLMDGDIGAYIARKAPNMSTAERNQLANGLFHLTDATHRVYASAAAVYAHNSAQRPNASVTLFATDAGVLCVGGTIYDLRPRNTKVKSSKNFAFDSDMILERILINPADITNKFVIVGNSAGYENDKIQSFKHDVSVVIGSTELRVEESPWASINKRRPKEKVDFLAQVYLDAPVAEEIAFGGMTLTYNERSCGAFMRVWKSLDDSMGFNDLTQRIMQRASSRVRPGPRRASSATRPSLLNIGR